jgi:hypothetical protein
VTDPDLVGHPPRLVELRVRERLALRGARDGVVTERVVRERGDDARVDAARERDQDALPSGERVPYRVGLLCRRGRGHATSYRVEGQKRRDSPPDPDSGRRQGAE